MVVRRCLVEEKCYTGEFQSCLLADGSQVRVPLARVYVDTPFFVGEVNAWCMEKPIYDLIIGNISGARESNDPDLLWTTNVVTRQQAKNRLKPYKPLKVPKPVLGQASPTEIRQAQQDDITLTRIRGYVEAGKTWSKSNGSKTEFVMKNHLIYREFNAQNGCKVRKRKTEIQ